MELNTPYQYKALNEDSYNSLAAYATTIPATVTLHPGLLTIVISENAANEVGQFIDENGLDFHINQIEVNNENLRDVIDSETTDADTLRNIISRLMDEHEAITEPLERDLAKVEKERDEAKHDRDMYKRWHSESLQASCRVKSQIQAIAVLVNSIFPEK